MSMTFTESFLARDRGPGPDPRHATQIESDGHRHRRGPRAGRPAVHPRRRRLGRLAPATRSTTSARSASSRPTPPPTTSPSSPPGPTTRAGTPRSRPGCTGSRLGADDAVLVFSVGGGDAEKKVSTNIVAALDLAKERGAHDLRHRRPRRRPHRRAGRRLRDRPADASPTTSPPTPRGCAAWSGTCWSATRRWPARRPSGSPSYERRALRRDLRRRRRRLHRQPLRRSGCSPTRRREQVTVYDNFTSGRDWHLEPVKDDPRLRVVAADVGDLATLTDDLPRPRPRSSTWPPTPTSPRRSTEPGDRLRPGHAAHPPRRRGGAAWPGSGWCSTPPAAACTATSASSRRPRTTARWSRRRPTAPASSPARRSWRRTPRCSTSPSGPSASATSSARSQTHGVGFDFVRRLLDDPTRLRILGDGKQSKSYIHVEDVIDAVLLAGSLADTPFDAFNVATGDYITVTEIAELAMRGARPRARVDGVRLHRRRPRLEGRRARRPDRHRQDPRARLGQPAHRSRGAARLDDRRWPTRPARVCSTT